MLNCHSLYIYLDEGLGESSLDSHLNQLGTVILTCHPSYRGTVYSPVIPATGEAEISRIRFQTSLGKKLVRPPISIKEAGHDGTRHPSYCRKHK
jgi:hypothetical protein